MAYIQYGTSDNGGGSVLNTRVPATSAMLLTAHLDTDVETAFVRWYAGDALVGTTDGSGGYVDLRPAITDPDVGVRSLTARCTDVKGKVTALRKSTSLVKASAADEERFAPALERPGRIEGWETWPVKRAVGTTTATTMETISGNGGNLRVVLPPDRYIPPIRVQNFTNLIIIGGGIRALPGSNLAGQAQRMIYLPEIFGVAHIEAVHLDATNIVGAETDGVAFNGPTGTLRIRDCLISGLRGTQDGNHADLLQCWNGLDVLDVDGLTGGSDYQGIKVQLTASEKSRGRKVNRLILTRVNIRNLNEDERVGIPATKGAHHLWLDPEPGPQGGPRVTLRQFYSQGPQRLGFRLWPREDQQDRHGCTVVDGRATWPPAMQVDGSVIDGPPPGGDFVTTEIAGPGAPATPQDQLVVPAAFGSRLPYAAHKVVTPAQAEAMTEWRGLLITGLVSLDGRTATDCIIEARERTESLVTAGRGGTLSHVTISGLECDSQGRPKVLHPVKQGIDGSGFTVEHADVAWTNDGWSNAHHSSIVRSRIRDHQYYCKWDSRHKDGPRYVVQHRDGIQSYGKGALTVDDVEFHNETSEWPLLPTGERVPVSWDRGTSTGDNSRGPRGASSSMMFNGTYEEPMVVTNTRTWGGTSVVFNNIASGPIGFEDWTVRGNIVEVVPKGVIRSSKTWLDAIYMDWRGNGWYSDISPIRPGQDEPYRVRTADGGTRGAIRSDIIV